MAKLDSSREELGYLKLWLGIMVVTGISLIGWLLTSVESAPWYLWFGGFISLLGIILVCVLVHGQIRKKIKEVEEL